MKRKNRAILAICACLLLLVSWAIVIKSKSPIEKQSDLMKKADALMMDGIYVRAVPLLEEAAGYKTKNTQIAQEQLKKAYLALLETRGYRKKYRNLLEEQMRHERAEPEIFLEAAEHYMASSQISEALKILRYGIEKTGSENLVAFYESNRYGYEVDRNIYEKAAAIFEGTSQVYREGLWGIANADGILLIPCQYDKISTFYIDRAIVMKDDVIYAVNKDNNRISKLSEEALDFGNYAQNRIGLLLKEGWKRANGEFDIGSAVFEEIGMYSGGYAYGKIDGKWGVVDQSLNWLVPAIYEGIVCDELGRCYGQGAVFVKIGNEGVYLLINGQKVGGPYDDARPFSDVGFAAVKRNGKWGYIDLEGTVQIGFQFEDALSFGQHLAAVKTQGGWGYINESGRVVIEPIFDGAKSFSGGSAPVLTTRGWQFITLLEYRKEVRL